jgi:hypothetical protein
MGLLALPESGVATIVVGVGILILGYLIKFRGWTFLLAGYDPDAITDEDAVADLAGGTIMRISIAVIVFGAITATGTTTPVLETIFGVVILVAVARLIYRMRKYAA